MTASTETRLSPGQRLVRGVARTAAGPIDITRGTLGLCAQSVAAMPEEKARPKWASSSAASEDSST